jgi:hypothetical protein
MLERPWRLWAARHSLEERPAHWGAQPLPRVRERATSKVADSTAFDPPGTVTSRSPRPRRCRRARRRRPPARRHPPARRRRRRARRRPAAPRALRATRATLLAGRRAMPSPGAAASPRAVPDLAPPLLLIARSARGASARRAPPAPRRRRHSLRRPSRHRPRCPSRRHPRRPSRRRRRRPGRRRCLGAKAAWQGRSRLCRRCPRRRPTEPPPLPRRRRRRRGSTAASRRRARRRRAGRGWRVAAWRMAAWRMAAWRRPKTSGAAVTARAGRQLRCGPWRSSPSLASRPSSAASRCSPALATTSQRAPEPARTRARCWPRPKPRPRWPSSARVWGHRGTGKGRGRSRDRPARGNAPCRAAWRVRLVTGGQGAACE